MKREKASLQCLYQSRSAKKHEHKAYNGQVQTPKSTDNEHKKSRNEHGNEQRTPYLKRSNPKTPKIGHFGADKIGRGEQKRCQWILWRKE